MSNSKKSNDGSGGSNNSQTPLEQVSMEFARAAILEYMFYRFQGARPELDDKLKQAFKKRFGFEMMDRLDDDKIHAFYLEGMPGHGKTTSHREACREFASLMDMRFHEQISIDMVASNSLGKDDFVFTIIELAGETSSKETAGLVTKMKAGGREFLGHLPDWRLAATMMGGYGYVLFDDFVTSTHQVQNSMLGLLLNGSVGDLSMADMAASKVTVKDGGVIELDVDQNKARAIPRGASPVQIGIAGNRGIKDGNKVFPITTATSTRVYRWDVTDDLKVWIDRAMSRRNDAIGDFQLGTFLQTNPDLFTKLSELDRGMLAQSPVPRTWDILLTDLRIIAHRNGGLANISEMKTNQIERVLDEIDCYAGAVVGTEAAGRLTAYYHSLFMGAAPIANAIISRGEIKENEAKIKKRYNDGKDNEGVNFGYSLASSMAAFCVAEVRKIIDDHRDSKKIGAGEDGLVKAMSDLNSETSMALRGVFKNLAAGVSQFSDQFLPSFAVDQTMRRLSITIPELFFDNDRIITPRQETALLMATAMVVDNVEYRSPRLFDTLKDSLSSSGVVGMGEDGNFDKVMKSYKKP
jgi:hypothetical protein